MSAALKHEVEAWSRKLHALLDRGERLLARVHGLRDDTLTPVHTKQIKTIVAVVSRETGISERQIFSRLRTDPIALARQQCIVMVRVHVGLTSTQIGAIFHREPSGVTYAVAAVNDRIATDSKFAAQFARINDEIETKLKSL